MRLLIECARSRPDPASVRAAAAEVRDWDDVLRRAVSHRMTPLLYAGLQQACPEYLRPEMQRFFRENARRSLTLSAELLKLLHLFEEAGIRAVPFKGPVMAWWAYESPALREMSDLDVLIRREDLARTLELLRRCGYRDQMSCTDVRFFQSNQEMPLVRECTVDLHWGLLPRQFRLRTESFWERLTSVEVAGHAVRTFGVEDTLLFLCLHGSKHGWTSLAWLSDVARLIARHRIDWASVSSEARRAHVERPLSLGLLLARDLLGADVPELPADPAVDGLARSALAAMNGGGQSESLRFQLTLCERIQDKARMCGWHFWPTPADFEDLRIPAALFPVYFVARPLRLAVKHTLALHHRGTEARTVPPECG